MKAITGKQYFHVVLYYAVLGGTSLVTILGPFWCVTSGNCLTITLSHETLRDDQVKYELELQCFRKGITVNKFVVFSWYWNQQLALKSADETIVCAHSNKSNWPVLSCVTVCYAVQGDSNFYVYGQNPRVWLFIWKLLSITFMCNCGYVIQCSLSKPKKQHWFNQGPFAHSCYIFSNFFA